MTTQNRPKSSELSLRTSLRKIARIVGETITENYDGTEQSISYISDTLTHYASIIEPWATRLSEKMVAGVDRQNIGFWRRAADISKELDQLVKGSSIGSIAQSIIDDQVKLFKSIPLDAVIRAQTIHSKIINNIINGDRSSEFVAEIMRSGHVCKSRADLIARTETGRVQTALTQARAVSIGSDGYIWRTVEDRDVRHSHAVMDGKFVNWSSPPTLDGMTGHAGQFPNCRCYCEVIFK